MALEVTDGNITEILKENKITLIDFWAEWCGPCRMLGPIIDQLAIDNTDIAVCKFSVDQTNTTAGQYGVRSIPTIIFFKDGEVVDKMIGARSKADIQAKIDSLKA